MSFASPRQRPKHDKVAADRVNAGSFDLNLMSDVGKSSCAAAQERRAHSLPPPDSSFALRWYRCELDGERNAWR